VSGATLIKTCLAILAFAALSVGLPATFAPGTFFDDYPFFSSWVGLLPPYNQHLVTDVGGLYVGFGFLFVWALIKPSRQLILPLCIGWFVAQALHFLFHLEHLEGFGTADAIAQTVGLALITLIPLIPISILADRKL